MTTIDELEEMDFVDWDAAAAGTGFNLPATSEGATALNDTALGSDDPNMDLVFGNIEGDDWSFWALEHFESTQVAQDIEAVVLPEPETQTLADTQMYWETPEAPCTYCASGGYQCKRIREGKYKGYCTSCVALRCECSFGSSLHNLTAAAGATFPANPWPTMGDRPETSILLEDEMAAIMSSAPPNSCLVAVAEDKNGSQPSPKVPSIPKIGARFSRESVKILKNWVSTHSRHPYPTEEEKESLQKMTGLNKTQITNWLANARRRGKIQPTRATSPHIGRGYAQAIDIPQRRSASGLFENMNPLQRWENSPPENEPASVTAIARAVSASNSFSQPSSGSGRNSPYISNFSDDGSSRSLCNQSSASSLGTSHSSGGSFASSFSHQSRGSFGSLPSFIRGRGRRRRRRAPSKRAEEALQQPLKTFQCTFCTETFRTKHDWQRHEKSLHLSLERWVCSPDGPRVVNPENGKLSCVFCGEADPDDAHVESHNFSGCLERTQEERTFYRKDHLRQHLKLVHNVKFLQWSMDKWRVNSPEIRSRCGFCGIVMDSWTFRVDHLAEHFKTGNTMADWKGDWGFDTPVLEMVENSIPPYMIHDERKSPLPYMASQSAPGTPSNAYELLKIELQYWIGTHMEDTGREPTDDEVQHEACRIVFGAEGPAKTSVGDAPSWLRDLVISCEEVTRNAIFQPIRKQSENRMSSLRINGKGNIFAGCDFERQLQEFVRARQLLGLTAMDQELQTEACCIIGRFEEKSSNPSEIFANWLIRLIHRSPKWLEDFRQRAQLPRSEDVGDIYQRSKDPKTIDSTIYNYSRLEWELGEFIRAQRSLGIEPSDPALQRQARIIIYDVDDEWNQTAADDKEWLSHFRERHGTQVAPASAASSDPAVVASQGPVQQVVRDSQYLGPVQAEMANTSSQMGSAQSPAARTSSIKTGPFFLNDANCYRRLARGLSRFVASLTSPNNPNRHVPTDDELQHQARWIVYDDDDPWNQTAADNAEWLQRFKRDVGILPESTGPGLSAGTCWAPSEGGTGFAPPYVFPNPSSTIEPLDCNPKITFHDASKVFEPDAATANHFLQHLTQRYPAPAKVFCSRELETGLSEYVKRELVKTGIFPDDESLKERARQIMGMQKTPCDDSVLLNKFKVVMQEGISSIVGPPMGTPSPPQAQPTTTVAAAAGLGVGLELISPTSTSDPVLTLPTEMDVNLEFTEQEMNDILQDVSPNFSGEASLNPSPAGSGNLGAASTFGH